MYFCITRGWWVIKNGEKVRNVLCERPTRRIKVANAFYSAKKAQFLGTMTTLTACDFDAP